MSSFQAPQVRPQVGWFACLAIATSLIGLAQAASGASSVVAWGDNRNNQLGVPAGLAGVGIAAGGGHSVAIQTDGTVVAWGYNPYGQLDVPAGLNNVVAASAGYDHSLALRGDGTVVAWGRNYEGQCDVPAGLNNVVAVSAAEHHSLALKSDGSLVAWGNNSSGQNNIPAGLSTVSAIAAGAFHCLALKSDGTVVGWGADYAGQATPPAGLANVVAIAAGVEHSLAVKNDGTVVAWGGNFSGQTIVPAGLSGVMAVSGGWGQSLALKSDGTVVAWGRNDSGEGTVPADVVNVAAISCGFFHNVALVRLDTEPPKISCPPDIILACEQCNTDPANTGVATAIDNSGNAPVGYTDSVEGVCPKVVRRTWTAEDDAGNKAQCQQTIACLPTALVTDSSRCLFDRDPSTLVQDLRLVFTQDPQNWPCYKLNASNPGQFMLNVIHTGTPGEHATLSLTLPYPFVTQGANAIQAYDWVSVSGAAGGACLLPGNPFFVSSQQVTLASYGGASFTSLPLQLTIPESGVLFLTIHLDYGLKKFSGYTPDQLGNALDCATGTSLLIPNRGSYSFTVSGATAGSALIQNINAFKRNPGVAGLVQNRLSLDPIPGASLTLLNAKSVRVASGTSDEDGFYKIIYAHKGKAATYYVSIVTPSGYRKSQAVTLKANQCLNLDFLVP